MFLCILCIYMNLFDAIFDKILQISNTSRIYHSNTNTPN